MLLGIQTSFADVPGQKLLPARKIDKYINGWNMLLDLNSGHSARDEERILKMEAFPYEETVHEITKRVVWELEQGMLGKHWYNVDMNTVELGILALIKMTNQRHEIYYDLIYDAFVDHFNSAAKVVKNLEKEKDYEHYTDGVKQFVSYMGILKDSMNDKEAQELPSFRALLVRSGIEANETETSVPLPEGFARANLSDFPALAKNASFQDYEKWAQKIAEKEEKLKSLVIDQDEAVQDLVAAIKKMERNGNTKGVTLPPFIGLPGTGKDTLAKAFTWALQDFKGTQSEAVLAHMYEFPVLNDAFAVTEVMGSSPGYVGSDQIPSLLDIVVKHSNGKYKLEKAGHGYRVVESKDWAKGIRTGSSPAELVLFINELHDYKKRYINEVLKPILESRTFRIRNPNGGLKEIQVNCNIIIASNHGVELLSNRNPDGTRFGMPVSYDELLQNYERVKADQQLLRDSMMKAKSGTAMDSADSTAISPEVVSRFPLIRLLKPTSPQGLQRIAMIKLKDLAEDYADRLDPFGKVDIVWDPSVAQMLQEFDYVADEGARPMVNSKIPLLVEQALDYAEQNKILKPSESGQSIRVKAVRNEDHTYNMKIEFLSAQNTNSQLAEASFVIPGSMSEQKKLNLTPEKIKKLSDLDVRIKSQLFGQDAIVDEIVKLVRYQESLPKPKPNALSSEKLPSAMSFGLFGMSSVGKTELAKILAQELKGSREHAYTIDFSGIRSAQEANEVFFGRKNSGVPSEFMREYDKRSGNAVIVLDELTNSPYEVKMVLYNLLREPIIMEFNDTKPRVMSNVLFILTGNAGQEFFIESAGSDYERLWTARRMMKDIERDPNMFRSVLEQSLPPALLNRLSGLYAMGPLDFKALRSLTQRSVINMFNELSPKVDRTGWKFSFANEESYWKFIETIEHFAYTFNEQGASIVKFVEKTLQPQLFDALHKTVASGENVEISVNYNKDPQTDAERSNFELVLKTKDQSLSSSVKGKIRTNTSSALDADTIHTAYHEAGHEIVRQVYLSKYEKGTSITIIPGSTFIGGRMIQYLGLATSQENMRARYHKAYLLRRLAVLYGGAMAQEILDPNTKGDAGKSNDYQRAYTLAKNMILVWGLVPELTNKLGTNADAMYGQLTAEERKILEKSIQDILSEARRMAYAALKLNETSVLIPMGKTLAQKGEVYETELNSFYRHPQYINENDPRFAKAVERLFENEQAAPQAPSTYQKVKAKWQSFKGKWFGVPQATAKKVSFTPMEDTEIRPDYMPESVMNIADFIEQKRQEEIRGIQISDKIKIGQLQTSASANTKPMINYPMVIKQMTAREGVKAHFCAKAFEIK